MNRFRQAKTTELRPEFARPRGLRLRFWRITLFFVRVLLTLYGWDYILGRKLGLRWLLRDARSRHVQMAQEFRALAVSLGGVMIKLGQFFSTRVDLLPPEVTIVLAGLQDEVAPVPWELIVQQIERELGGPPAQIYRQFDPIPVGAASLGQVHRAMLADETPVAVKIQRPGIRLLVETDLEALRVVMELLKLFPFIRKRMNVNALMEEFADTLIAELDYIQEGRHAELFRQNFADDPKVRVPLPYWPLTTVRVLTLEWITGIKINDYAALEAAGISRIEVAHTVIDAYFKQMFRHGFYHADPHPGNLFIQPLEDDGDWPPVGPEAKAGRPFRLAFVDFGMVGTIPPTAQAAWRQVLIAMVKRDAVGYVQAMKDLGFLLPNSDDRTVIASTELGFKRLYGLSLIEMHHAGFKEVEAFGEELRAVLYEFPFQVPQNVVFLGRCIGLLVGISSGLDPTFNPITAMDPWAREFISVQVPESAGEVSRQLSRQLLVLLQVLTALPPRLDRTLQLVETGQVTVRHAEAPEMISALRGIEGAINRLSDTIALIAVGAAAHTLRPADPLVTRALWATAAWLVVRILGRRPPG